MEDSAVKALENIDFSPYIEMFIDRSIDVIIAILIFFIGRLAAKLITAGLTKGLERKKADPLIIGFLRNIVYYGLIVAVIIAAIARVGIPTTSFVAVLGAAGLAIGLALQGSLSNFASGILLLLFRPFRVGDFVTAGGDSGFVEEIGLLMTILRTPDNKTVFVPNSNILESNITNNTLKPTRRIEMIFGISYTDDIDKARDIIAGILKEDDKVLLDPAPQVAVSELGDSSVNFVCRPWVKVEHYWDVYFGTIEKVKKAFDANDVSIPFPQRDVHLYKVEN
jgi:small conductance mechanosensitive channel